MLTIPLLALVGCGAVGSTQMSIKMGLVSTSPNIDPAKEVKKENRTEEFCTWSLFNRAMPLGDEATPAKAFAKLNAGAEYINDLVMKTKGFNYSIVAKDCWLAEGVAAISTGAN